MAVHIQEYDLKQAVSDNRLRGMVRILTGFWLRYISAILSLAVATAAKALTFLLLAYFVDTILVHTSNQGAFLMPASYAAALFGGDQNGTLLLVGLGFILLALVEGAFVFNSGRLAARTGEGIALRMRNYVYDHLQRLSFSYHDGMQTGELIQRSTSDVDAVRRFFADQVIGVGAHHHVLYYQFHCAADHSRPAGSHLGDCDTDHGFHVLLLLQAGREGVQIVPGAGRSAFNRDAGKSQWRARGQGIRPTGLRDREIRQGKLEAFFAGPPDADDDVDVLAGVGYDWLCAAGCWPDTGRTAGH